MSNIGSMLREECTKHLTKRFNTPTDNIADSKTDRPLLHRNFQITMIPFTELHSYYADTSNAIGIYLPHLSLIDYQTGHTHSLWAFQHPHDNCISRDGLEEETCTDLSPTSFCRRHEQGLLLRFSARSRFTSHFILSDSKNIYMYSRRL